MRRPPRSPDKAAVRHLGLFNVGVPRKRFRFYLANVADRRASQRRSSQRAVFPVMKPMVGMDSVKTSAPVVVMQPAERPVACPRRTRMFLLAAGLFILAVVVVILAVYTGAKISRDSYQEGWKTAKTANGMEITERRIVRDGEEEIDVANSLKVILDHKHDLEVSRMVDPRTRKYGNCYAKPLEHSEDDGMLENGLPGTEVEYEATTEAVADHLVSDSVREMCEGAKIFWLRKTTSGHRTKREIPPECLENVVAEVQLTLYMKRWAKVRIETLYECPNGDLWLRIRISPKIWYRDCDEDPTGWCDAIDLELAP